MELLLKFIGTCGLAAAIALLCQARRGVFQTTLGTAWCWQVLALILWTGAWAASLLTSILAPGRADQLWYLGSVLMLCPLVAVLGARKPGHQAWNWFVLVPLVLVLNFPSFFQHGFSSSPFEIEAPVFVGFCLVLVMGVGNYFGTRFTPSVLLLALALILCVGPVTGFLAELFPPKQTCRIWGTISLSAALLTAAQQAVRGVSTKSALDRLWIDYRDFLGIVWAKRIMDRINHVAQEEQWPVRLELHGFVPSEKNNPTISPGTQARIEQTLRRLLKRFVKSEWIDRRLNPTKHPDAPEETL